MKTRTIALPFLALFLTACGNDPIEVVQDSYLKIDETITVGQAFSNRKICDDVEWQENEDARGRIIVEYSCEIDVGDYFEELKEKNIENAERGYENVITAEQREIDSINKTIAEYKSLVTNLDAISEEEKAIWNVSKKLSSASTRSWGMRELPEGETVKSVETKFELMKNKYGLLRCTNYVYLPGGEVVDACRRYMESGIESKQSSLQYHEDIVARKKKEYKASLEKYENESTVELFEYAQWSFKEIDGELYPKLLSMGYRRVMENGADKKQNYHSADRAIRDIYKDKMESVEEFSVSHYISL